MATVALQAAGGFGAAATAALGYVPPVIESAEVINNEHTGTAQAAGASTLTLAAGASATDDFYVGAVVSADGPGETQYRRITDYNGTTKVATVDTAWDTTGVFQIPDNTTSYRVYSGNLLSVTFDEACTYLTGSLTVSATPIIGQSAQRTITTVGAPVRGDGTATHIYALRYSEGIGGGLGKPVNKGETGVTVAIAADVVETVSHGQNNAAQSGIAVTNNSQHEYLPHLLRGVGATTQYFSSTYTIEVEAMHGFTSTAGRGLTSVTYSISDGSGPVTGSLALRTCYDNYALWGATDIDISSCDDGALTVTVTATSDSGMGARSISWTIYKNAAAGIDVPTWYIDGTSGNDTTGNGTSGTPYATIGKCIDVSRIAADAGCIINIKTAGTYRPLAGGSASNWTHTHPIIVQPDPAGVLTRADVILQAAAADTTIKPRIVGTNWTVRNCTINLKASDSTAFCQVAARSFYNCRITDNMAIRLVNPGTTTPFATSSQCELVDCLLDYLITSFNSEVLMARNCDIENIKADAITSWGGSVINCRVKNRSLGAAAFTVQYTLTGPATINKTGNHAAGNFVLIDPVNGTTTFDLTNASYDTFAELVAAIDAVAGWNATLIDGTLNSDNIYAFVAAVDATAERTVWQHDGSHSDMVQLFGSGQKVNYGVSGFRTTGILDVENTYLGLEADKQVFWFDHAGPLDIEGMLLCNIAEPTFAATNTTRSSFHGNLRNWLHIYNTYPFSKHHALYTGGATPNSEFAPTNFIFAYNVNFQLNAEIASGGPGTGADFYQIDNHYDTVSTPASTSKPITGDDYTDGAVEDEFVSLASPSSYDLTPASDGQLVSRVPRATFADIAGGTRSTSGAIGAYTAASGGGGGGGGGVSSGFRSRSRIRAR